MPNIYLPVLYEHTMSFHIFYMYKSIILLKESKGAPKSVIRSPIFKIRFFFVMLSAYNFYLINYSYSYKIVPKHHIHVFIVLFLLRNYYDLYT